jgi:TetR/AcrR family transcriptional repressor of mexCD-oprJ operon
MAAPLSRSATALVDEVARALGVGLATASMADIARAAGISRATLYRSFPTREALLRGVVTVAIDQVARRVGDADLERVDVREGVARVARAFIVTGSAFTVLARTNVKDVKDEADLEARVAEPLRALLARGVADGTLRDDLPVATHFAALSALLEMGVHLTVEGGVPAETAAAAVASLFLDGAAA